VWSCDDYIAKAKKYMEQGEELAPDSEFHALLMLLGLEFLLRAPLARVHPILLATEKSALYAAGFPAEREVPRSVTTSEVLARLERVVPTFATIKGPCARLAEIRNHELHSSDSPLAEHPATTWLPDLLKAVEILAKHLNLKADDFLSRETIARGAALRAENDERVRAAIATEVARCKQFVDQLQPEELAARAALPIELRGGQLGMVFQMGDDDAVPLPHLRCPSCGTVGSGIYGSIRESPPSVGDYDQIVVDRYFIFESFRCRVCGLHLSGPPEARAVGIVEEYKERVEIDPVSYFEDAISAAAAVAAENEEWNADYKMDE
jgi:hypothetical protein